MNTEEIYSLFVDINCPVCDEVVFVDSAYTGTIECPCCAEVTDVEKGTVKGSVK